MYDILNKYFDHIYVLYIDQDELDRIQAKLIGVKVEYYMGVDGRKELDRYNKYVQNAKNREDEKILNPGSYGHILSFTNILRDARKHKYQNILILEPDIYFCRDFTNKLDDLMNSIKHYKLLYLGASQYKYYNEHTWNNIKEKDNYYLAYKTLGTFSIAIDSSMYDIIIKNLLEIKAPTDVCLVNIQEEYPNDCLVSYPNIICCDITKSKTGVTRNQLEFNKLLRWDLIKYDFTDIHTYQTEYKSWYEINLTVNSYYDDYKLLLLDKSDNILYPELNISNTNDTNNISILFFSNNNHAILRSTSIFISKSMIKKVNSQYIKLKISNKTKNPELQHNNINNLR
jgi:GR25 family glycosyltransferase involved in LPS biosynthesis